MSWRMEPFLALFVAPMAPFFSRARARARRIRRKCHHDAADDAGTACD